MARVAHFEIHASDPKAALAFYGGLFGWTVAMEMSPDYLLISSGEGPGIDGAIMKRMGPPPAEGQPVNGYVCTLAVSDIDAMGAGVVAAGGVVAVEKMAVAGFGWNAYFKDPDGNIFGLWQDDPAAA
jgi:hypothetical protein